eukprot:366568-Chlamydomonas_euryale.AAC.10
MPRRLPSALLRARAGPATLAAVALGVEAPVAAGALGDAWVLATDALAATAAGWANGWRGFR